MEAFRLAGEITRLYLHFEKITPTGDLLGGAQEGAGSPGGEGDAGELTVESPCSWTWIIWVGMRGSEDGG